MTHNANMFVCVNNKTHKERERERYRERYREKERVVLPLEVVISSLELIYIYISLADTTSLKSFVTCKLPQ